MIPNPETPLALLPPQLASQFEVSRYLLVATCGMFSWDILTNLSNDWRLLTKYRVGLPTIAYFASRMVAFAYIISSTAFQIGAVGNCQALQVAVGWTFAFGVGLTALLFFFRIQAIFHGERLIVAFFAFTWFATLAGSMTVPFAITGAHIGPTNHCINTGVKPFSSVGVIISTVNDTLVFVFISVRLMTTTSYYPQHGGFFSRIKAFFRGEDLPSFSRSLLQSGQQYYLITVGGNILTMGMILAPASLPAVFHAMFTVPNMALANSMACRVYREIKFGRIDKTGMTTRSTQPSHSLPSFTTGPRSKTTRPRDVYETGHDLSTSEFSREASTTAPDFGVTVTKSIYQQTDVPMEVMLPPNGHKGGHEKGPHVV
ncbi:hypothetical protein M422DRAFT_231070 [Sphaerobolus stellatus SS14]|uniref:Uncharacterized protein n=1 Tax=Sphaerobolus stellatus (strain SS14) TaxID=990650 RepID=A0A0C9VM10_SPHS4|nr:hypothetical protein M422DRAFT_231070 [Sphaerobolus stellatus SS14]